MTIELLGYRRQDGRWGFRNHVLVLPVHAAACGVAERVAGRVPGAIAVTHDWTGQGTDFDRERVARVIRGFASHPNVFAAILIGLDGPALDLGTEDLPWSSARYLTLAECGGMNKATEQAFELARGFTAAAAQQLREPAPISALCLGLECGGSDALSGITANPALGIASDTLVNNCGTAILAETSELIGAEHLLAARAVTAEVGADLLAMIDHFEEKVAELGVDLRGGQPVPGNIAGGLTTIEEKSLGAAKKGGGATIQSVLEYAVAPSGAGLHVMDTPGNDIEQMVGMVAAGCHIVAFTTGRGTPTGSPIAPCLKISSNSAIFERLGDDIDIDAGTMLSGAESLDLVGNRIYDAIIAAASGQLTASERHGNLEFAISREQPRWQNVIAG